MEQERIIRAIIAELERQSQEPRAETPYVWRVDGKLLLIDGHVDMPALAKAISEAMAGIRV